MFGVIRQAERVGVSVTVVAVKSAIIICSPCQLQVMSCEWPYEVVVLLKSTETSEVCRSSPTRG